MYVAAGAEFHSAGRKLFDQSVPRYVSPEELNYKLPDQGVPEIAFVGRSNVGKSSLISALIGHQHSLVRVGKTPGLTRSVNYFALGKRSESQRPELYLVDLPGYGFAKAAKTESARWREFIEGYLRDRDMATLRRVFVLVDSRHGLKASDATMMLILDGLALPYEIVLTKTDAASKLELSAALTSVFSQLMRRSGGLNSGLPFAHAISSKEGTGIMQLKASVAEMLTHRWAQSSPENNAINVKLAQEVLEKNPGISDTLAGEK